MGERPEFPEEDNPYREPASGDLGEVHFADNVWIGLGIGFSLLVLGMVLTFTSMPLMVFIALGIVFVMSLAAGFYRLPRLAVGLLVAMGLFVILAVGGCMVIIAINEY